MSLLRGFMIFVDALNDWVGKLVSILVFPLTAVLVYEVVMRYVFNRPTIWAHELSAIFYAIFFLLGGAYTLRWKAHINVDIVYLRLSPRFKAGLDLITWLLFYFFCGVLLMEGTETAWTSLMRFERASTVWEPYIWPVKLCIPLAAALILLQGITKTMSDFYLLFSGHEMFPDQKPMEDR